MGMLPSSHSVAAAPGSWVAPSESPSSSSSQALPSSSATTVAPTAARALSVFFWSVFITPGQLSRKSSTPSAPPSSLSREAMNTPWEPPTRLAT